MYCQNCVTEIPEGGGFCSECGKPVNAPVQQAAHRDSAVLESNAENINPKPRNPHATKIAIGIAAGVLLLIIVGVALLSFAGRSPVAARFVSSYGMRMTSLTTFSLMMT